MNGKLILATSALFLTGAISAPAAQQLPNASGAPGTVQGGASTTTQETMPPPTSPAATQELPGNPEPEASLSADGNKVLAEIDVPTDVDERLGSDQQRTALMQTTLLNRFSQMGFSEVRDFRREGESYIAEALSRDGDWVTIVMDPVNGTIVARQ